MRNSLAVQPHPLKMELDRLLNQPHQFLACIRYRDATGQVRNMRAE